MPESPKPSDDKSNWARLGNYAQLGFLLPAATFVGWLIGAALDHWLRTTWLYIPGLLLGVVAGFIELIREVIRGNKNS